jgi:hypothetical protein
MRYHKTVFCIQLKTKKGQVKKNFENLLRFFSKIRDFQMTQNGYEMNDEFSTRKFISYKN